MAGRGQNEGIKPLDELVCEAPVGDAPAGGEAYIIEGMRVLEEVVLDCAAANGDAAHQTGGAQPLPSHPEQQPLNPD